MFDTLKINNVPYILDGVLRGGLRDDLRAVPNRPTPHCRLLSHARTPQAVVTIIHTPILLVLPTERLVELCRPYLERTE